MEIEKLTLRERLRLAIKIIFHKKEDDQEQEWTDLHKRIFSELLASQYKPNHKAICNRCGIRESRWSNGKCNQCDDAAFGY